ncbi:AAA family ATPase [Streptomyces lunaelactis]|uniref:AAA family ATPase n=1 Tax=Streptomyces lunaelactis TaxID=1535768 RepID=UPI001585CCAC|nr:AAA family ATPase [Streptomyces lunaelactis]NUL06404.1 AAA family ATPase [Streptomyces lunaelactis]
MTWDAYYRGDGVVRADTPLPAPPPWRRFPSRPAAEVFRPPVGLIDAVNAALALRRPLLITGGPGTGKSTVIEQVAAELALGPVLRWHITSRSSLADALYRYDALGRIHAHRLQQEQLRAGDEGGRDDIASFLHLGPLGTALLPSSRPRALLIDEIDKADLDLPGDLLDVLERGEFRIAELMREGQDAAHVRMWDTDARHLVENGHVQCTEFPFIVMTSNGEQELPAPFLRRCVRYTMPKPTVALIREVVRGHLNMEVSDTGPTADLVDDFVRRVAAGESVAIDQLLGTLHLLNGPARSEGVERERLIGLLMKDLSGA